MTYSFIPFYNGNTTNIIVIGKCILCNASHSVFMSEGEFSKFNEQKGFIQDILPTLSLEDREFLISGQCSNCQNDLFGENSNTIGISNLAYRFDQLKDDHAIFENILSNNNISSLYHFTDIKNIQSIKDHGSLYSSDFLCKNKIDNVNYSSSVKSRDIDFQKGLSNFIRLSFTKEHPMLYAGIKDGRIITPVLLEIDPKLLLTKPVLFTLSNAARNDSKVYDSAEVFSKIDFSVFTKNYLSLSESDKSLYQSEILVPERITFDYIKDIQIMKNNN